MRDNKAFLLSLIVLKKSTKIDSPLASPPDMITSMNLSQMRKAVFAQKPIFARIIKQNKDKTLGEFYQALGQGYTANTVPTSRKQELILAIERQTKRLLGEKIAKQYTKYLRTNYWVSTAGHHDTATHPFFSNYLIVQGHCNLKKGLPIVPVLTCAGISINNSSSPRSILFHDQTGKQQKLHLISLKNHHHPVYGHKGYQKNKIENEIITPILKQSFFSKKTLSLKSLSDQLTHAVARLYQQIPGMEKVTVIHLEQETIAADLIIRHHLRSQTIINQILFNQKVRAEFLRQYNGIAGSHDQKKKTGTHLFWGITPEGRKSLMVKNNQLISNDGQIKIDLNASEIKKALTNKRIMPAMSITLTTLSFYYGLACAGGFSQVNYLAEMKEAFLKLLTSKTNSIEIEIATNVPTDLLAGDFILTTLPAHTKVPATPIDIIMHKKHFTAGKFKKTIRETRLGQAIDKMMPELYAIVTGSKNLHGKA